MERVGILVWDWIYDYDWVVLLGGVCDCACWGVGCGEVLKKEYKD